MTITREAIIISDDTRHQVWEIDPIPLEVDAAGYVMDSGPLDAVLEAVELDGDGMMCHAVWADTGELVLCAD